MSVDANDMDALTNVIIENYDIKLLIEKYKFESPNWRNFINF